MAKQFSPALQRWVSVLTRNESRRDGTHVTLVFQHRVHVIFSTKERARSLPHEFQPKLWAYVAGIAHNQAFEAMIVGGVEDHVHALLILPPSLPLSKAIQFLKGSSSKWINDTRMAEGTLRGRKVTEHSA
jgi:REP element-mobilizing transposase RayT